MSNKKCILEKLFTLSFRLYYTHIGVIQTYATMNLKFMNLDIFAIWHDRLDRLGSIMMRRIIENSHGHLLKSKIL